MAASACDGLQPVAAPTRLPALCQQENIVGNILDRIVADKREEVAAAKVAVPLDDVRRRAHDADAPRDFFAALAAPAPAGIHLIAEIKRRSPSAGLIRADFDPVAIARTYASAGASAISVLTDAKYFDGQLGYIAEVRDAVSLPVLRKDFVVDAYQIWEARAAGADAVLLIAEVLGAKGVAELTPVITNLGMTALIEAYDPDLFRSVVDTLGEPLPQRVLLGINNRDLTVQRTDLATTERLAKLLADTSRLVTESGIHTRADVERVQAAGAQAMLVGESIMCAPDMAARIRELLGITD
ncbi:MAG: indole-3-glycerol phosphate synthase TrpC [Phycisphaerales bacterium]|nr:indole-3-glycerol phosphate synthase TrpC [Phycisphaerales bacterium]